MSNETVWQSYNKEDEERLEELASKYIDFISYNKTEREFVSASIKLAKENGYVDIEDVMRSGQTLSSGDKVFYQKHGKSVVLVHLGTEDITHGMNILGAHVDSPRLDLKQNPLIERNGLLHLDTHYYGGIKPYQWVTIPLALHGVVALKDGSVVPICIGEDEKDPVFCVSDLLIHLAQEQMKKTGSKVVESEDLDVLVGSKPAQKPENNSSTLEKENREKDTLQDLVEKEPVKAQFLQLVKDKYGIEEEDFLSAEIEVVPAGRARELGVDRSMILGYGQDDSSCAYPSLLAQLSLDETPKRTAVTVLVDKEEIGSVGATGMDSHFFENAMARIINCMEISGYNLEMALRLALESSQMLSSDVSAALDPAYLSVFDTNNAAYLGKGLVFNKYTGSRGKSGSNDASAEYMARIRRIMSDANVAIQTAELGKVDIGGGGTIAYMTSKYGMDVIDAGVAVLSMHAPWEVASKADLYEAYKGYCAFLES